MGKLIKLTATILSAVIMVQSFTSVAMAAETSQSPAQSQTTSEPDWSKPGFPETSVSPDAQIVSEVKEKRTENSKTFAMDDGTFLLASYNEPIHYKDSNGAWQDIDNTMSSSYTQSLISDQTIENKAGNTKIKLSKTAKPGNTISLNSGNYTIGWGLDGVTTAASQVVPNQSSKSTESHNDQFLNLKKLHSEILYKDALPGIDVQYLISSSTVKENIILNSKDAQKQFTETYQIGDLTVKQKDSQTIELFAKSDTEQKNAVYTIAAPKMIDAADATSDAVSLNILQQNAGTLQIAIHADETWLNDQSRVYPVSIDPNIDSKRTSTYDTFISEKESTQTHNAMGSVIIGNESLAYGKCRVLVKFGLPALSKGDMVVQAQLSLFQNTTGFDPSYASMQVNAYEMTSSWSEDTATWSNTKAATDTAKSGTLIDYVNTSQSTNGKCSTWGVTKLVKKWYNGSATNNGLLLTANDEDAIVRNQFDTSENPDPSNVYPGLSVRFVSNIGLEDYWGYHSQPTGRAGTGSVNDYTGNLVFTTPIMNTTGARAPMDFSITYNGYQSGTHFQNGQKGNVYGWGWQSNLSQRVGPVTDPNLSATYKYAYIDKDGTTHYFIVDPSDSSKFVDEDGLGFELTTGGPSDDYYTLNASDGTKETFTGSGYLHKIYDSNSNAITLSYIGANLKSITDGAGRVSSLDVSQYNSVTAITGPDNKQTQFHYYGGNLTSITYSDGKTIQFTYDSDNRLQKAIDIDNSYIQYGYSGTSGSDLMVKNRVSDATEYSTTGEAGNKVTFTYNPDNTTTFQYTKSGQTQTETYNFDNFGRATSVVNADKSASVSTYTAQSTKDGSANKMTSQASTSAPVINLLKDHNAELNNGSWAGSNWGTPGGTFSVDSTTAYLGSKSLKIYQSQTTPQRSGAVQAFTNLTPGTVYTLSAYVKTSGVSSGLGANLYVASFNGSTSLGMVNGKGLFGDNAWQRTSVTFTVPTGATRVEVYGGLSYANGTAWFDCLQLETGSAVNNYNLLENSDFRYSASYQPLNWTATNTTSGDGMSGGWLRIGGNTTLEKNYYQTVYINKPAAGISLAVSGKAQGKSIPVDSNDGQYFAIDVGIAYTDNSVQWNLVNFNPDSQGEQYTSGIVTSNSSNQGKTISRVVYYIIYYKNANEALFKDLQLNFNNSQVNNVYDSNGNLKSTGQNGQGSNSYTYTGSNEVSSSSESSGDGYSYTYVPNNDHQIATSRSTNTNMGQTYSYDTSGNVTDTKTGAFKLVDQANNTYAFDENSPYTETSQTYDANKNYVTSETDERGNTTSYGIDSATGITSSIEDPNGYTTYYNHDLPNKNLLTSVRAQSSAGTVENTYGYDSVTDSLNSITHNGFSYTFAHDGFGNTTGISVGTQSLLTNVFNAGNGNLFTSTLGNGFKLEYGYDSYDRVTSIKKNGSQTPSYQYIYDARGNLAKSIDKTTGTDVTSEFSYDINDRLIQKSYGDGSTIKYSFDNSGRSSGSSYSFVGQSNSTTFKYGPDGQQGDTRLISGEVVAHQYDTLNRETTTSIHENVMGRPYFNTERSYVNVPDTKKTTPLIGTYSNTTYLTGNDTPTTLSTYQYTYDNNGNILTITDKDGKETKYTYDHLNQLVRADDQKANVSTTYSYDVGGNITGTKTYAYTTDTLGTATGNVDYTYGNTNWKDLLTSYNGQNITYDAIGNPLSYRDGMSFTWEGRQLKTTVANGKNLSYTYNDSGIRTSKTVNGVTTNYFLDGSTILAQKTGSDVLWFLYDSDGTRVGFTYNGTAYYYTTNAQGDVTGITDSNCNTVVEYSYDAWGKLLSTTGSMANSVGKINPFLYRGYYYDSEMGFYWLQSRYYDPEIGRFINADAVINEGFLGANLFAYCENNPIMYIDPDGYGKTYVFYYDNRGSGFKDQAMNSPYYNKNSKDVVMIALTSVADFKKAWNNMNGTIDRIYLYLHGGTGVLYFKGESMSMSQIKSLNSKSVKYRVYLFSCHGGDGKEGNNVAWAFAKLTSTSVIACTGSVSYSKIFGKYYARKAWDWGIIKTFYYQKQYIWWGNVVAKSTWGQW